MCKFVIFDCQNILKSPSYRVNSVVCSLQCLVLLVVQLSDELGNLELVILHNLLLFYQVVVLRGGVVLNRYVNCLCTRVYRVK